MNLGELKKSLSRFPSDMDDTPVLFQFIREGKTEAEYGLLSGVAYTEKPLCVLLLEDAAAMKLIAQKAGDKSAETEA